MKNIYLLSLFLFSSVLYAKDVVCLKVTEPPKIDGNVEQVWITSQGATTKDIVEHVDITLKCLYDTKNIYFLASYPDDFANIKHKALLWNDDLELYQSGPTREDTFIFKFAFDQSTNDLSLSAELPYSADIWYWKGFRTDPIGFADDKMHHFSTSSSKKSRKMIVNGKTFHLSRPGDHGSSSYKSFIPFQKTENEVAGYVHRTPEGSRGDIKAKGHWENKTWNIEFARKLKTGNIDDIQFEPSSTYKFGVSINEIAGGEKNNSVDRPNHGTGDISELMILRFK